MTTAKPTIDPLTRRFHIGGTCPDIVSFCGSACCREWDVLLSDEEAASGRYRFETRCNPTDEPCTACRSTCFNRIHRLVRTTENACIYLGNDLLCTIYKSRPAVCDDFNCFGGWKLATAASNRPPVKEQEDLHHRFSRARLSAKLVFVKNPLETLSTLIYAPENNEAVFITKRLDTCGFITKKVCFESPFTDASLEALAEAFDGCTPLGIIHNTISGRFGMISWDDFCDGVLLFIAQNIIVFVAEPQ